MPVSQRDADTMLEEFLAQREVTKIRRGAKGPKQSSTKPDPLERREYAPDNSRIGNDSRGMQSRPCSRIEVMMRSQVMQERFPQAVAHAMVEEWLDAVRGMVVPSMVCTVIHVEENYIPEPKHDNTYFGVWNVHKPLACVQNVTVPESKSNWTPERDKSIRQRYL